MPNPLSFVDLPCPDPAAAAEFYAALFGWRIDARGGVRRAVPDEGPPLGLVGEAEPPPDPVPRPLRPRSGPQPRVYIEVDRPPGDYLNRAVILGATALWEQTWWPELGRWHASFLDPWGNQIVVWSKESP